MCYEIGAEVVLANLFRRSDVSKVTISKLKSLCDKIETQYPAIYVDVTKYSISSAISYYPNLFTWDEGEIAKVESSERLLRDEEYIMDSFNNRIPDRFREAIVRMII